MRLATKLLVGAGTSAEVKLDQYLDPFNVSVAVIAPGVWAGVAVQHTHDDVFGTVPPANWTWFNHPVLNAGTGSGEATYSFPVGAVRLVATTAPGGGTGTLIVRQAGVS